jgi:biotin carboxyl carrier protein
MRSRRLKYDLSVNGKPKVVEVSIPGGLLVDGKPVDAELILGEGDLDVLKLGHKQHQVYLKKTGEHRYDVWINRFVVNVDLSDERDQLLARFRQQHSLEKSILTLRAPMPGVVTSIHARVGESVESGGGLLVLEAMKMENEICSPHAGTVRAIMVKEKTAVEKDQPLLSIEPI